MHESNPPPTDSLGSRVVAVADFRATMLSKAEADTLTDGFCKVLGAERRLRLVDRKRFAGLRNSNDFGPLAQCTQLGCALDIGRQFEADAVVIGAVSREGKGLVLTIRLVDVEDGVLRQKFASEVYSDQQGLLAHAVPELVARLLDTSSTAAAAENGPSSHPDPGGKPGAASKVAAREFDSSSGKTSRKGMDGSVADENSMVSKSAPRKPANLDLAKVAAFGAAVSGGLVVGGIVIALTFPATCSDRSEDGSRKLDGECAGTMLNAGFFLYRAGLVVGCFSAVTGVLAVVQKLLPAKRETPANRRLVLLPLFDPTTSTVGLATRLDF
jgi:TolB-like protein